MAWDYTTGTGTFDGGFDLAAITGGADAASPLTDVSNGGEPMQTYTATGNGSGVFIDSSLQNQIFGGLSKVLDYAIKRDAYQMGMQMPVGQGGSTGQQLMVQRKQTNGMFLLLCGVGLFMVLKA